MALDFPSSPTNGQVSNGYVYNSTVGAWQIINVGAVTMSETAPTSPYEGQLWLDETSGQMYVYYNDGTSSQWIAAVGGNYVINTDGDPGRKLYVGSVDPDGTYTLQTGDVWIQVPGA